MHASTASQPKPDNLFGICAAVGEDFGFNPLWLRIALGAGLLWNPAVVIGAYVALGLLVLATRLLFPDRKQVAQGPAVVLPQPANADEPEFAQAA